jgi:hypothetical protein
LAQPVTLAQTGWQITSMKIKLTNVIKILFGIRKPSNLDGVFNKKIITEIPMEYVNGYPYVSDWMNGRAYALNFLVSEEDYDNLVLILKESGYSMDEFTQDQIIENKFGLSICFFDYKKTFHRSDVINHLKRSQSCCEN